MAKLPYNKTWTKEGTVMCLLESTGRLFNVDRQREAAREASLVEGGPRPDARRGEAPRYFLPVADEVIREAVSETMAPMGTVIRGAGSSGFLRRNKVSANDIREAADKNVPGVARRRGKRPRSLSSLRARSLSSLRASVPDARRGFVFERVSTQAGWSGDGVPHAC